MDVLQYFIIVGNWLLFQKCYNYFRQVENALGSRKNPLAYDIRAACSGFVLGLVSAACHNLIISLSKTCTGGGFRNVLVIAADALSRFIDWSDRGVCILFGDADGAVVVRNSVQPIIVALGGCLAPRRCLGGAPRPMFRTLMCIDIYRSSLVALNIVQACESEEDGLSGFDLHSDCEGIRFPPRCAAAYSIIDMNGKEVFRFVARSVPLSIESALEKGWNEQTLMDAVAGRLEVPTERVISNYGNTSAASVPLALDEAVRGGKVLPGHIIATSGFGAGLTWASAIVRWRYQEKSSSSSDF
ncbi:hypothetical protein Dimus_035020 [Dionaea muscipula]